MYTLLFPSLRYLQFESRILPSLTRLPKPNNIENVQAAITTSVPVNGRNTTTTTFEERNTVSQLAPATAKSRSSSLNTLHAGQIVVDEQDVNISCGDTTLYTGSNSRANATTGNSSNPNALANAAPTTAFGKSNQNITQPKLPSLSATPKITASLDNCKCFRR